MQGLKGDQGLQGLQGLKGDQGLQGLQGLKGDQGLRGLKGDQGLSGGTGASEKYFIESPDQQIQYEYSIKDERVLIDGLWWKLDKFGLVSAPQFAQQIAYGDDFNDISYGAMVFDQPNCAGQSGWLTDADQRYVTIDSSFVRNEAVSFASGWDNYSVGKVSDVFTGTLSVGNMDLASIKSYLRNGSCVSVQNVDKAYSNAYTAAINASKGTITHNDGGLYYTTDSRWNVFKECLQTTYDEVLDRDITPSSWTCLPSLSNNSSAYLLLYETGIFNSRLTNIYRIMSMRSEGISSGLDLTFTIYDYELTPKPGNLKGGWKVVKG